MYSGFLCYKDGRHGVSTCLPNEPPNAMINTHLKTSYNSTLRYGKHHQALYTVQSVYKRCRCVLQAACYHLYRSTAPPTNRKPPLGIRCKSWPPCLNPDEGQRKGRHRRPSHSSTGWAWTFDSNAPKKWEKARRKRMVYTCTEYCNKLRTRTVKISISQATRRLTVVTLENLDQWS